MMHKWTKKEIQFLKENVNSYTNKELAMILGLRYSQIIRALERNKIKRSPFWTKEKIKILKNNINTKTNKEIAIMLSTNYGSIASYITRHKIKRKYIQYHHKNAKEITYTVTKTGCHECTSHVVGSHGYPTKYINGKRQLLSHIIYEQYNNTIIPNNLIIRHKCHNRLCINPKHLVLGTHQDNANDKVQAGRSLKGSKHPLSIINEEQVKKN